MNEDEYAITQLLYRYARAVDRLDREGIAGVFHPDATLHIGPLRTTGAKAPDDLTNALRAAERTTHFISNIIVDVNGDKASSEAYARSVMLLRRDGRPYTRELVVRLVDRHEKRNGRWAIIERVAVYEWSRIDPVVEEMEVSADWVRAERSRNDPVYRSAGAKSRL